MAPYDHDRSSSGGGDGSAPGPRCPICAKPAVAHLKPFCSKRCADIDLHRWIEGVYRVPDKEPPESDDDKDV